MASVSASGARLDRPLRFERIFLEKVWGGRSLEKAPGIALPIPGPIGETWELVDRSDWNSIVADGPTRGRKLRDLVQSSGRDLLGRARTAAEGTFPLLIKYLDASQPLSVQVHPDHPTAKDLGVEGGKTECWYILSAAPGARIYLGLKPGVDAKTFAAKAAGPDVVELLTSFEVEAGQFVFVPAGTVHAIGAGITLAEIQENCDVTFRLYDWGRVGLDGKPRPAHVKEALRAIRYDLATPGPIRPRPKPMSERTARAPLVDCEAFQVELLDVGAPIELATDGLPRVYMVVRGRARLARGGDAWSLGTGDVWLLPASLGAHALEPAGGDARILAVRPGGRS